jgi:hypothetical protein
VRTGSIFRIVAWIALGFVIGAGTGLLLGWVIWPLEVSDANPSVMEQKYQTDYALMIAAAYSGDEDLQSARLRLGHLTTQDIGPWLQDLTLDQILDDAPEDDILPLVRLALDLGQTSAAFEPYLEKLQEKNRR